MSALEPSALSSFCGAPDKIPVMLQLNDHIINLECQKLKIRRSYL